MITEQKLDMGRHGFGIDLLRRCKRVWRCKRVQVDMKLVGLDAAGCELERRRVRTAVRAEATSGYRHVFAGIERFSALSVYAHGSWGDGTMTPFSDYDDLVIVDYGRVADERELREMEDFLHEVDARFCHLDPLQHHGHWIIGREELAALDESYIPLSVLDGAVCVQGDEVIEYRADVERAKRGFLRNVRLTCDGMERLYQSYRTGRLNAYDMKCLAGSVFIVPAYVFQVRGEMLSKRDALRRAGELFSATACSVIAKCTEIRSEWGRVVDTPEFTRFRRVGGLFRNGNMHRRYARALAPRFPKEEFPCLEESEVRTFIQEARDHANRE